jgi:hypothetical protein
MERRKDEKVTRLTRYVGNATYNNFLSRASPKAEVKIPT